jgi:hypothetical protein
MRKEEITFYTFEELSQEGKYLAIRNNWKINLEGPWTDRIERMLTAVGIKLLAYDIKKKEVKIYIQDFHETATDIAENWGGYIAEIAQKFLARCKEYSQFESESELECLKKEIEFRETRETFERELEHKCFQVLEREYKSIISNEAISEAIERDYFTDNGEMFKGYEKNFIL